MATNRPKMPRTVWALGFVSLFMDLSSEIIHALLPVFLTVTLGASVAVVGAIDGIAEATASISKIFSGWLSDKMGRRKPLILLGYGLAALSKPLFPLAASAEAVLAARFADRIGKGLRGAPRDALVADVTPAAIRGRAFGLRQAMDTVGAFAGPLLATALMLAFANDIRAVFWVALVPAFLCVACVVAGVEDPPRREAGSKPPPIRPHEVRALGAPFWGVTTVGVVFTLARFSEAFLILRATGEGLPIALAPMVLVAMNLVYAIGAYPAGALADRLPARRLLLWGLMVLIGADALLAWGHGLVAIFAGIGLWGAHMALTQGLLAKMVADTAPTDARGSAYGLFNLASGVAMLGASLMAGLLWSRFGPEATFIAGGAFAALALLLALVRRPAGACAGP
jgi:MFS family permease